MEESLAPEHSSKQLGDTLENLLDDSSEGKMKYLN
jgi:hypothetical protein